MLFHHAIHAGQPHPTPLAHILRREKRLENLLLKGGVDSRPGVFYFEPNKTSLTRIA